MARTFYESREPLTMFVVYRNGLCKITVDVYMQIFMLQCWPDPRLPQYWMYLAQTKSPSVYTHSFTLTVLYTISRGSKKKAFISSIIMERAHM